ncbi:MAG: universal stress protein, partial [Actinobacteria bacterium]|nr:universal stress protein [Actinomycetota bacterium]
AAVELARAAGTDLKLIAASDPSMFTQIPDMAPAYNPVELLRAHGESLARAVDEAIAGVEPPPAATGSVESGSPAEVLAGAGADGVDMIVAGSRGYGPVKVVLLGSVSAKLVRSARCPVMVVPRG